MSRFTSTYYVKVRLEPHGRQRLLDYGLALNIYECADDEICIVHPSQTFLEEAIADMGLEKLGEIHER